MAQEGGKGSFAAVPANGANAPNPDAPRVRAFDASNSLPVYTIPASAACCSVNTAFIQSMTARTQGARRRSR